MLNEDVEVEARISKAKSLMGAAKYFFDNKDIDKRNKSQIYVAGLLNALLWGCESWNITKKNLRKPRTLTMEPSPEFLELVGTK